MTDAERLLQWMKENGYTTRSLAAKTGDTHTNIYYMTGGGRGVNDAFKWRFQKAFGHEEAKRVFGSQQPQAEYA